MSIVILGVDLGKNSCSIVGAGPFSSDFMMMDLVSVMAAGR
jgi:hypothetical protein